MGVIDDYIAPFPANVRKRLEQMRRAIRNEAPDATETISYAIPTFDMNGQHLVHFAGFAHHTGLYPGALGMKVFAKELAGFKTGKGSVQFPLDAPLPLDLVRQIVRFRVEQCQAKRAPKRKK